MPELTTILNANLGRSPDMIVDLPRLRIADLPIAILSRTEAARITIEGALDAKVADRPPILVTTLNGQSASLVRMDQELRGAFDGAEVILADGMSVVMASRMLSPEPLPERLATTDIFHDTADCAVAKGATFFFLGATREVCRDAVQSTRRLYPGIQIVGWRDGYFGADGLDDVLTEIDAAAPDVLWVGMGIQRQMRFAAAAKRRLRNVGCIRTCGGLFDFLADRVERAPRWMQASGFEWLFRMLKEPRRLGLRYLTTNPHAAFLLLTRTRGYAQLPAAAGGPVPAETAVPRRPAARSTELERLPELERW